MIQNMEDALRPNRKFVETFDVDEWEVETDDGWTSIEGVSKTISYRIYEVRLEGRDAFRCADTHTLYLRTNSGAVEVFAKDLSPGDEIVCKTGSVRVVSVVTTDSYDNMYDLKIAGETNRFYTSELLSHNSLWLGNLGAKCMMDGHNVAVLTFEMSEQMYIKRMGSNLLSIPISDYKSKAEDLELIKGKISQLGMDTFQIPGKLVVKEFPTSAASVPDIEAFLLEVEARRGIKFKMVVVDYINIVKNWRNPNTENTYIKIKQIAEDLRAMAVRNDWAVITATQVKQAFFDSNDLTMGSAAESSALVATVDLMFGIIQDPQMYINNEYKLKVLANRNEGLKNASKRFLVDYKYMRITEDSSSSIMDGN